MQAVKTPSSGLAFSMTGVPQRLLNRSPPLQRTSALVPELVLRIT